jgi:hypothetical protein
MHMPIAAGLMALIGPDPEFYSVAGYFILPLVLAGSYAFYLFVEWPGHIVARSVSKWVAKALPPARA